MKGPLTCDDIIRCCKETPDLAEFQFVSQYTFYKIKEVFRIYCEQFGHDDVVDEFKPRDALWGLHIRCDDGIIDFIYNFNGQFEIQRNFYVPKDKDIHLTDNNTGTPLIDI